MLTCIDIPLRNDLRITVVLTEILVCRRHQMSRISAPISCSLRGFYDKVNHVLSARYFAFGVD